MVDRHGKGYKAYRRARERLRRQHLNCWWCGGLIDYDAPPHHPGSFEADHDPPLSKGGDPIKGIKPSHSHCNRTRGNSIQPRLRDAS